MASDVLIVGGGVIGLSLADCLLREGLRVAILDKGALGQEASWAGAGMLTCRPRLRRTAEGRGQEAEGRGRSRECAGCEQPHPELDDCHSDASADIDRTPPTAPDISDLKLLSVRRFPVWAERLKAETGIDIGYRVCGALEVLLPGEESAESRRGLEELAAGCNARGIVARWISGEELRAIEPGLHRGIAGGLDIPGEAQVRNPRYLRALIASVKAKGAEIREGCDVADVILEGERACGVVLRDGTKISAGNVVLSAGAWAGKFPLVNKEAPSSGKIEPVRGQILAYLADPKLATRLLTSGNHYVVPRGDGIVLLGATHEKVGFNTSTTAEGQRELEEFGRRIIPGLGTCAILKSWAGLRPGLKGRHPLIGPVGKMKGLFVAAGHYRNGLVLSVATAEVLSSVIVKKSPPLSIEPWLPG